MREHVMQGYCVAKERQMDCAGPGPNDVMRTPKTTDDMPGGILLQMIGNMRRRKGNIATQRAIMRHWPVCCRVCRDRIGQVQ